MAADRFDLCWPFVLKEECPFPNDWSNPRNFSNDRHDKGGATMCGIIQREYDHFRKVQGEHTQPVQYLTREEGRMIYRNWYWLPHCPELPPGLDLSFFDAAVNEGSTEAVKILQHSLGVAVDGIWGPVTVAAVARASPAAAVTSFAEWREKIYLEMHDFQYFGVGWTHRTSRIKLASEEMAVV